MNQRRSFSQTTPDRQHGAALLVFMLIFFLAGTSLILSQVDSLRLRREADRATSAALAHAREALIGRAVADSKMPGSLPCPSGDDSGEASLLSGNDCPAYIGRLPWKTLALNTLRDGNGNTLWYVLAPEFRDDDSAAPLNPKELELWHGLTLDGTERIAAIVLSTGPPLAGQNGRPSNELNDYLEGANLNGGPYISGPTSPAFNDKTIAISHDQLFSVVNRRIIGLLSSGLDKYYNDPPNNNLYPEDGVVLKTKLDQYLDTTTKTMLNTNGWYAITTYTPAADRRSATLAITVSPAITCTIMPAQKPSCTHP